MKYKLALYQRIGTDWIFAREADYADKDSFVERVSDYVEVEFPDLEPEPADEYGDRADIGYDESRQRQADAQ